MSTIGDKLAESRRSLTRVSATEVAALVAQGALLVDIRPALQRSEHGEIPGAIVIERNVLEWRLDPTSPDRHPSVTEDLGRPVIVVCQEGYASSLAAASLQELGLRQATDLIGGFAAWQATGLRVERVR